MKKIKVPGCSLIIVTNVWLGIPGVLVNNETVEPYYTHTDESVLVSVWGGVYKAEKSKVLPRSSVALMSIISINSTYFVFRDIICM